MNKTKQKTLTKQIKIGILKHTNVNVKTIKHAKKIIVGTLKHVFMRKVSIQNCCYDSKNFCNEYINTQIVHQQIFIMKT